MRVIAMKVVPDSIRGLEGIDGAAPSADARENRPVLLNPRALLEGVALEAAAIESEGDVVRAVLVLDDRDTTETKLPLPHRLRALIRRHQVATDVAPVGFHRLDVHAPQ